MIKRYSRKEMEKIWEEKNKYQIWLDIEIAAAEAIKELGAVMTSSPGPTSNNRSAKVRASVPLFNATAYLTSHN